MPRKCWYWHKLSSPSNCIFMGRTKRSAFMNSSYGATIFPGAPHSTLPFQIHSFTWPDDIRRHPYKVLQGASHSWRRGSAFSVRDVKYWNKLPVSVVTAPSVNILKKRLDGSLSPSPPLTEHSPPYFSTPPIPPAHHPLTVIISICYPPPCSIYVVSLGPLWPS